MNVMTKPSFRLPRGAAVPMLAVVAAFAAASAFAQSAASSPASQATGTAPQQAAEIGPRVDTSAVPPRNAAAAAAPGSAADGTEAAASRAAPAAGNPAARPDAGATAARSARVMDRVDLEASQITGNRELPRVLYIVPWRAPQAGELEGRPVNSLLNELTRPVDRDVFRRENRYFNALQAQSPNADAAAGNEGLEK